MNEGAELVEVLRGGAVESVHRGHVAVWGPGGMIAGWGDPEAVIFPRSSCKMIQALPLIESGAADAARLTPEHLALACASHQGARIHTDRVTDWLDDLGLTDSDFRCGPQTPADKPARNALIRAHAAPCQVHNNCSGKHAGFLTLNRQLGGDADYVEIDHPVQRAVRAATEEVCEAESPYYGIDGCSAPNFAMRLDALAMAMAGFASAEGRSGARAAAQVRLVQAMMAHPELVAGVTRACTELMRAMPGRAAIKTGAEGVFFGILPERQVGFALKITDGTTRAAESVAAALLVALGVLEAEHPLAKKRLDPVLKNWRGIEVGAIRPVEALRASL
ncbi:asparaginase [Pseudoroseicyclus aestuarii]|uniref:asparaginase n=1 Tax=Pseudoroseicyclus aestuarii TaxID=1795041 RepID=UPI003CCC4A24